VGQDVTLGVSQGDSATQLIVGGKYSPTDADSDTLTVSLPSATSTNGAAVSTDGSSITVDYSGVASFSGTDGFEYTISDGFGGTVTKSVIVTVTPASTGANINGDTLAVVGGVATMQAFGIPGAYYHLQYTINLSPVDWQDVTDGDVQANPSNGTLTLTDSEASGPSRYYRTRYVSGP